MIPGKTTTMWHITKTEPSLAAKTIKTVILVETQSQEFDKKFDIGMTPSGSQKIKNL